MSQLRYGILETINAIEGKKVISVLVAGTGRYELPKEVSLMAQALGKELAINKMKLICGGWDGVDYLTAESYLGIFYWPNLRIEDYLIQVVPENTTPAFSGNLKVGSGFRKILTTVLYVKQGIREWLEAIKYSDIAILIGGEGGTYETFMYSHQEGRPVIPIQSSGGDAAKVFNEIITRWDYWKYSIFKSISYDEFNQLTSPIENEADASYLAKIVVGMIKQIV